jgi:hypothetical protein
MILLNISRMTNGIFLLRAIWRCGLSDMFFSNIKKLRQCGLCDAVGNPQEIMVIETSQPAKITVMFFFPLAQGILRNR